MKVIKVNEVKIFKNSDNCVAYEYPMGDKNFNVTIIELSGRYPEKGSVVNKVCKEIIYVIEGSGTLIVGEAIAELNAGDQILIEPEEKFHYLDCDLKIMTVCVPAWYPEQHVQVG